MSAAVISSHSKCLCYQDFYLAHKTYIEQQMAPVFLPEDSPHHHFSKLGPQRLQPRKMKLKDFTKAEIETQW